MVEGSSDIVFPSLKKKKTVTSIELHVHVAQIYLKEIRGTCGKRYFDSKSYLFPFLRASDSLAEKLLSLLQFLFCRFCGKIMTAYIALVLISCHYHAEGRTTT